MKMTTNHTMHLLSDTTTAFEPDERETFLLGLVGALSVSVPDDVFRLAMDTAVRLTAEIHDPDPALTARQRASEEPGQ